MKIVIQKFGGTSVSTKERRENVIKKVKKALEDGFTPVVVVSAMGRSGDPYATDTLLSLIHNNFKTNNKIGTDLLMSCGETISSVVMSNDLFEAGIDATPLTGWQSGIITDSNYTDAKCIDVKLDKVIDLINKGKVPVVTGFQGVSEDGFITTLGRGGSDTTAALLGVYLEAEAIEIYTDVDGIMTADPRIVKDAALIDVISYSEVFQLADQGAKVIHPKAVDIAMRGNVPLLIKNTMSNSKGTLINSLGDKKSQRLITGITSVNNRIQVSVELKENINNSKYRDLLEIIAANKISLDLINIFPKEQIFTIDSSKKEKLENILNMVGLKYSLRENCSTVAVVGARMTGIPGVMAKIIKSLSEENIEVLQTADSNMTIWCLIPTENVSQAVNSLHKTFGLS